MNTLAPGEHKILEALKDGGKRFKDLYKTCVKNPTLLSVYLKHLQKIGLIWRNVDTREFQLQIPGWESLFLFEITALIENYGLRKNYRKLSGLDILVSEDEKNLRHIAEAIGREPRHSKETLLAFLKINLFLFRTWKNQVLTFFSGKDRKMIDEYEQAFHDAIIFAIPPEGRINKESSRAIAYKKLKRRYPDVEIPVAIVELEAENIFRKMMENKICATILEIGNTKKLIERLNSLGNLTKEDKTKLKPLVECLEDVNKVNLYDRYMKRLRECPKTLIIFSSLAFDGYIKKRCQLFPDEEKSFKKNYPWLYGQIQARDYTKAT